MADQQKKNNSKKKQGKEGEMADQQKKKNSKKKQGKEGRKAPAAPKELPANIKHRIAVWDRLSAEEKKTVSGKKIVVTLPDGKQIEGEAGVTTPMSICEGISNSLAKKVVVAKVNGVTKDLLIPLTEDCSLELCKFDSPEGQYTFWHSSAHILGQAIELNYPNARLCIGPPIDTGGFYYDVELGDTKVSQADFKGLESFITKIQKEKQAFTRMEIKKEDAMDMFKDNKFKLEIIKDKIPDGETCSAYRCGPLIDLCRGPHVPSTATIKSMAVTKNSSAYWLGKAENPSLQRVYGISFPDKKQMKEWKLLIKQAEERDHRRVGVQQKLFFFHDCSPGSAFFLPHGVRLYNRLMDLMKSEYRKRGFDEVMTPNVFNVDLWKTSGHYANYKENMFIFDVENQEFGMKPMNCPAHCIMFKSTLRSYRDLPMRLADFGVLHRNELSGALSGLTRVRRFQQDDAHIFCRQDQIKAEVAGALQFLQHIYGIFGFSFQVQLSTRPEKYLGEIALWEKAEKALAGCLDDFGGEWTINPADGAFYGPKIDIQVTDALKRKHQCATIQLDFQLPIAFDLQYKTEGKEGDANFERPVIVHRAILGSCERMMAILIEHYGGKWPFWLSPRQAIVIPVGQGFLDYAQQVRNAVHDAGFYCDVETSTKQLTKKIREAQLQNYNYILVVGPSEKDNNQVNVRKRDSAKAAEQVVMSVDQLLTFFKQMDETKH